MSAPKGYVVRGMNESGGPFKCPCKTLGGAEHARVRYLHEFMCADVAIFAVSADGTETKLPSYEEALAMRPAVVLVCRDCGAEVERGQHCKAAGCVDPLAALEAAERRLLEAGGWTPDEDEPGYWRDGDGRTCKQAVAILQEKRRLAAKGGA